MRKGAGWAEAAKQTIFYYVALCNLMIYAFFCSWPVTTVGYMVLYTSYGPGVRLIQP